MDGGIDLGLLLLIFCRFVGKGMLGCLVCRFRGDGLGVFIGGLLVGFRLFLGWLWLLEG